MCLRWWHGDLRRLHAEAGSQISTLRRLLTEFPGVGPTGADIFLREVQDVWTDIRPYLDRKVTAGARKLHLPTSLDALARLAAPADTSRLASALVRVSLDRHVAKDLRSQ